MQKDVPKDSTKSTVYSKFYLLENIHFYCCEGDVDLLFFRKKMLTLGKVKDIIKITNKRTSICLIVNVLVL